MIPGKIVSLVIGCILLFSAVFIAVHATIHPNEHHPAWWLVGGIGGTGLVLAFPETAWEAVKRVGALSPWGRKASGGVE